VAARNKKKKLRRTGVGYQSTERGEKRHLRIKELFCIGFIQPGRPRPRQGTDYNPRSANAFSWCNDSRKRFVNIKKREILEQKTKGKKIGACDWRRIGKKGCRPDLEDTHDLSHRLSKEKKKNDPAAKTWSHGGDITALAPCRRKDNQKKEGGG